MEYSVTLQNMSSFQKYFMSITHVLYALTRVLGRIAFIRIKWLFKTSNLKTKQIKSYFFFKVSFIYLSFLL